MEPLVSPKTAYLDIETTGLSVDRSEITVVGVLKSDGFHGLVAGRDLSAAELVRVLQGLEQVYTYNGASFDLRFLKEKLQVDVTELGIEHEDLMYTCRRSGLRGGQKKIEIQLSIGRDIEEMDGRKAARLGKKWLENGDEKALDVLLHYNEEDVRNLAAIKKHLDSQE